MNLSGMDAIVSQLRAQKANFINQIRHVDAALAVLGKLNGTHVQVPFVRCQLLAGRESQPRREQDGQKSGASPRSQHPNERCQHHLAAR